MLKSSIPSPWRAALAVAAGGLALLGLAACPPVVAPRHVPIGALGPARHQAFVQISGVVAGPARYDPQAGRLDFLVEAEAGQAPLPAGGSAGAAGAAAEPETRIRSQILVFASGAAALALLYQAGQGAPRLGDRVTAQGTFIDGGAAQAQLSLPDAGALRLERPLPRPVAIRAIRADLRLQVVDVSGMVSAVRATAPGPALISLRDGSGRIDVVLDEALQSATPGVGERLRVAGVVVLFKQAPRLAVAAPQDIVRLPPEAAPDSSADGLLPIGGLRVGAPASIAGEVTAAESAPFGFRFRIEDGSGALSLILSQDVYRALAGADGLRPGARVQAAGPTRRQGAEVEMEPEAPEQVRILRPAPPPDSITPIHLIGLGDFGRRLTVEGRVLSVEALSLGMRLILADETGRIRVLLWNSVLDFAPAAAGLAEGQALRVTGQVEQYQGEMEIVPALGVDLAVR